MKDRRNNVYFTYVEDSRIRHQYAMGEDPLDDIDYGDSDDDSETEASDVDEGEGGDAEDGEGGDRDGLKAAGENEEENQRTIEAEIPEWWFEKTKIGVIKYFPDGPTYFNEDTEQYEVMVRTELRKRKHEGDKEMEKGKNKEQQQQQRKSSS